MAGDSTLISIFFRLRCHNRTCIFERNNITTSYSQHIRVYNDIVTTVGKGNGAMLVLFDLSAVCERIMYKILILTHIAFNGNAPPYYMFVSCENKCVVSTWSTQDRYLLCRPSITKICSNTFLERSFLYAAPHEWNNLERGVRVSEFNVFKKVIKTILFIQCYPGLNHEGVACRVDSRHASPIFFFE